MREPAVEASTGRSEILDRHVRICGEKGDPLIAAPSGLLKGDAVELVSVVKFSEHGSEAPLSCKRAPVLGLPRFTIARSFVQSIRSRTHLAHGVERSH
jgi:hypothetical protein